MKFTKEQLQEMYNDFKEYERERGYVDEPEEYVPNEIQPNRQIKDFDYFKHVVLPMVKKFQKYTEPPIPKNIEEYIYNRRDLQYILEHVQNPYLKYEQLIK